MPSSLNIRPAKRKHQMYLPSSIQDLMIFQKSQLRRRMFRPGLDQQIVSPLPQPAPPRILVPPPHPLQTTQQTNCPLQVVHQGIVINLCAFRYASRRSRTRDTVKLTVCVCLSVCVCIPAVTAQRLQCDEN